MVIGSHADVQSAKLEDVRHFFQAVLRAKQREPGDRRRFRSRKKARGLVEKYFGPLKRGEGRFPRSKRARQQSRPSGRAVVQDNVQLPRVYMAWLTLADFQTGRRRSGSGGKRSWAVEGPAGCTKKLVYEKQIAQGRRSESTVADSWFLCFEVQATAKAGVKPEDLEKAINAELDCVPQRRADGRGADASAKTVLESRIIAGLETLGGFGGVA